MTNLWQQYIFRRGDAVNEMWDNLYNEKDVRLLYIAGRGFDTRAQTIMEAFVSSCKTASKSVSATLLLVDFSGYELSEELEKLTQENEDSFKSIFSSVGGVSSIRINFSHNSDEEFSASNALRQGSEEVLEYITDHTDIVLDVSTLPRVVYLTLMTALLERLIPDKSASDALQAGGINLQVLIAEDAMLDSHIQPEDPSNELIIIPGFSGPLQIESVRDWPMVWFPILGENRVSQFTKVMEVAIPSEAEICPILPHPSRNPRRAEDLLVEYRTPLFDVRQTPLTSILYVNEAHPFEVYRQLKGAMSRYRRSLEIIEGCRLIVTPLGSKLITIGAALACFEMRPRNSTKAKYGIGIPYAEPRRYKASASQVLSSQPEICSLLLTGSAYCK